MDVLQVINLLFLVLLGYFTNGLESLFAPPRIFPQGSEYIIAASDNFTLRCEGKESVNWTYPDNMAEYDENHKEPKYSKITVTSSFTPDSEYVYGSILTIENASYLDTGYFYCHGNTTDFNNLGRVSSVYLYVYDPEHLSVISELPYAVTAIQHSQAIIPCRPTSPDVHVHLVQTTGEEIENVSYDPKIGYTLLTNDLAGHNMYSCEFSKDVKKFNLDVLLYIDTITSKIATPFIEEVTGGHTIVGEKLVLRCTLRVDVLVRFNMQWITPNDKNGQGDHTSKTIRQAQGLYYQDLTIEQTSLDDQGEYTCEVYDFKTRNNNTKYIRIYDKSEHFINLTEEYELYEISVRAGKESVQWRIEVKAHPIPTLTWYNNKGKEIEAGWSDRKSSKYQVHTESTEALLKINDIILDDRGYYKLFAKNSLGNQSLSLFLNVTDKPSLKIEMDKFHLINTHSVVKCVVQAYPLPQVFWMFKDCQDRTCNYLPQMPYETRLDGLTLTSFLNITTNRSGYVQCRANNSLGEDESTESYLATDVENGFGIWGYDEWISSEHHITVAKGDSVTLYCGASQYNYTDELMWIRNKSQLGNDERYTVEKSNTEFSNKLSLTIHNIDFEDSGLYFCQVKEKSGHLILTNVSIEVRAPEPPVIVSSNLNNSVFLMRLPRKLELYCYSEGIPTPTVTWYKNGEEWFEYTTGSRLKSMDRNQLIVFTYTQLEDEGSYQCRTTNRKGAVEKHLNLKFENKPAAFSYYYIIIVAMAIISFVLLFIIYFRYRKEKRLRQELKRAGLANFENGALESFNPELGIDDQAELLPYDRRFEFSREKLKLGKQLGSGAFGVVMKAEAYGIVPGEEYTVVAVKMVKRSADYTAIKALASELKIMVHLGQHLNVVNLLGACTKNVTKRELLVIVEYCRFGNIHNYLLRNREHFINQIDSKTGKIDYTFGSEILERSFSVSSATSADNAPTPKDMVDYRGFNYTGGTTYTESTAVSMTPTGGEDGSLASNNSVQPEWRSNYLGDYKGTTRPICTKDLITWAFQVARGMEYLASRKVLHGDLAARNILLAENNVVKICDFGLAKSIYKSDNYKKQGDGPLPVKWMAVESIRDRVFSTQSDVWSFGIVLWEFFSLARTPYPGMEADERLYNKLVDGYRMDPPQYATKEVYSIMCDCWHPKPLSRPSFTKIAELIGSMLEDSVRQHYVDLNDPYLVMNTQRIEDGQSDYLAMLSPPDFEHLSSPNHYINDEIHSQTSPTNATNTPGYLCMKSTNIFSPRETEENVFNFDVRKHSGEVALGTELLPMLHTRASESDCEMQSPTLPSFSNPSYHIPPNINVEKTDEDIVKSSDNYVNMPQNKSAMKNEKNNNKNQSTNINNDNSIHNYINSNTRDWESIKV